MQIVNLLQFSKTFLLEYRFEETQALKFVVLDIDDKKHVDDASRHDLIGEVECTLADIVTAGQQYKRSLREKGMHVLNNCNSWVWCYISAVCRLLFQLN